ncbi:hypothetical protein SLS64_007804 [Diaporthe eres]
MPTLETYNGYPLWKYIPSLPAAVIFIVLFGILTLAHTWKMFTHRMWFCIPFVVGGIFETIGYVGRALAYNSTGELIPYVLQSTLLLLGPILFAASLYMTLSRLVRSLDAAHCAIIPPRWLTRIFVFGDVFSFIIQASGAGLRVQAGMGKSTIDPELGGHIIVGGLIFQIIIFGLFIVTALMFHIRFRRDTKSHESNDIPWQSTLAMLYLTSAFVMIRNIFRAIEYAMGSDGYLLSVEWAVYVFDASLMTLTMAAFFVRYPSQLRAIRKVG